MVRETGVIVAVFLSTFANKIDRKGRVSVPAPFRAALEKELSNGLILYPSFKHPCIEGCGDERIEEIVNSIDAIDAFSEEAENLQTILASSRQLQIDGDGRIVLPAELIEFAGIDGNALFVGIGRSFQIWKPEDHEAHHTASRARAKEQGATLRILKNSPPSTDGGSR